MCNSWIEIHFKIKLESSWDALRDKCLYKEKYASLILQLYIGIEKTRVGLEFFSI